MNKRIIPVIDRRHAALGAARMITPAASHLNGGDSQDTVLLDQRQRPLRDLRISVTDRCNFRCSYCMPKAVFDKDYTFLPQSALLTFEEIFRIAHIAVAQGVEKIRLTGGEPLLRRHLERLIESLSSLRTPAGDLVDLTLTTNGSLLVQKSSALKQAGLQRVTVSLDALDETVFQAMNDVDFPVSAVLDGIHAAHAAGLGPIKINMVVKRGVNDHQIVPMARYFRNTPFVLRFIEYMDVGSTNGWKMDDVVTADEIIATLQAHFPLERAPARQVSDTAQRWRYSDMDQEIGVIASVTQAFCGHCTRARLSTEGSLYTCLFATQGYDLRSLLRDSLRTDADISAATAAIWRQRTDHYSELRSALTPAANRNRGKVEMSYIGG